MAAFFFVLHAGGWHYGQMLVRNNPLYLQATTATLSTIIVMQVANVFLCRSPEQPVSASGLSSNKLLHLGVAAEIALILLIDYTPWGNVISARHLSPRTCGFTPFPLHWPCWYWKKPGKG